MSATSDLNTLSAAQLRALVSDLTTQVSERDTQIKQVSAELKHHKLREQQLTQELALLKRYSYGKRSEGLDHRQRSLLEEHIGEDIAALEVELKNNRINPAPKAEKQQPKRQLLPPELPRTVILHEPDSTTCACGCQLDRVGEDISEKLDYTPGTFSVEQHIRGKWACKSCETLLQEPVAPHVIDKGIPTTNLLAQVLISKYADHLPLYRQQQIYARAGLELPVQHWQTGWDVVA